jgi:hypothetical protein
MVVKKKKKNKFSFLNLLKVFLKIIIGKQKYWKNKGI